MKPEHKDYIRFMIWFYFIPTTATFYYLQQYIHPLIAYTIVMIVAGTILYKIDKRKKNNNTCRHYDCCILK